LTGCFIVKQLGRGREGRHMALLYAVRKRKRGQAYGITVKQLGRGRDGRQVALWLSS
jgi:hypothetical protein